MVRPFDVSKFRHSLTKSIQGISVGFESDPNTWASTGNYTLNYLICLLYTSDAADDC